MSTYYHSCEVCDSDVNFIRSYGREQSSYANCNYDFDYNFGHHCETGLSRTDYFESCNSLLNILSLLQLERPL